MKDTEHHCTHCCDIDDLKRRLTALEAAAPRCTREGCGALADPASNPGYSYVTTRNRLPQTPPSLCKDHLSEWFRSL